MKNFLFLMVFSAISFIVSPAQNKHEVLIGGGAGLSTLRYEESKFGFGGNVNLGYAYNFSERWALFTGVEFDFLNAKTGANPVLSSELIHVQAYAPIGDDRFDYNAAMQGFSEKQKASYLSIPVMARYRFPLSKGAIYAKGGMKLGIPMCSSFDQHIDQYTTTGFSYLTHLTHQDEPEYGFSTYNDQHADGSLDLKFNVALALEAGYAWHIADRHNLYTGVYFDYGLNNVASAENAPVVSYNATKPSQPVQNSITAASSGIHTMALGVMLRYSLGFGHTTKKAEPASPADVMPLQARNDGQQNGLAHGNNQNQGDGQGQGAGQQGGNTSGQGQDQGKGQRVGDGSANQGDGQGQATAQQDGNTSGQGQANSQGNGQKDSAENAARRSIEEPVTGYGVSQATPGKTQKQELNDRIALLKQYPELQFYIYGHTCSLGDDAINELMGQLRADRAKAYMIQNGIAEDRILGTASKRDTEPLVPNTSIENRRKNRRVEIKIVNE